MGIDLRLESEKGEVFRELPDGGALVERFLPDFESADFPCLRFVDPYGDTVFNQLQIEQVTWELEALAGRQHEPEVDRHLLAVLEFVRAARGRVHTYIRFYGD
jgi:hypothetical protein